MSYISSIPQSSDDPKVSQSQILGNFGKINSDYQTDHVSLTSSSNSGFHKKVVLQNAIADPNFNSPTSAVYSKLVSAIPQLFFQNNLNPTDVFQLTNLPVTTVGTNYSIITPWNLKIQMGLSTSKTITFADPFSVGPTVYFAGLTGVLAVNPIVASVAVDKLIFTSVSGLTAYYLVIGLP